MKIVIESTGEIVQLWGVRCRVWNGVTEGGSECKVFIPAIAAVEGVDPELAAELQTIHAAPEFFKPAWAVALMTVPRDQPLTILI